MNFPMPRALQVLKHLLAASVLAFLAQTAFAQTECKHRGELDARYCDENKDLVADAPTDPKYLKNPSTLVFTYTPVEDPAVYENIFKPFTDYLGKCTGKRVVFYQVQSNAAEIEAMRSGRLHVGGFSTGPTNYAVNLAGAIPFAVKGTAKELQGYNLIMIVKKDSPYQKPADLKGKKVAHVQPSSNSGNLAPRALFPALGLTPDQDYKVLYSGKHDNSITGVSPRATTMLHRWPPMCSSAWWPAGKSKKMISALSGAAIPFQRRHLPTHMTLSPNCATPWSSAFTSIAFPPKCKRPSTAPTAFFRSLSKKTGRSCAKLLKAAAKNSTMLPMRI